MFGDSKFRRVSLVLLCLFVVGLVVGCGGSGTETSGNGANSEQGSQGQAQEKYVLKLAHDHQVSSPFQDTSEQFKKWIEERTDGRIEVQIYPAQQLGSSREMIEGTQMGTIEMTLLPTAKFGGFDQRLTLVDMPFLFPNEDILWKTLDGDIGKEIMSGLPDIGIEGICFVAEGWKCFTSNEPIEGPEFFKGKKWRVMEAPVIMATYEAWGANPVPIDFAEVYNSLQQGVVDGHENPYLSIHDMKFYEVQKYITVADHSYLSYFFSASKKWLDSLPEDLRQIVLDTTWDATQYHKGLMDEANARYLKNFENFGNEVVVLTEEQREAFRQASQPVYDEFRDVIGGDLIDRTLAFIEANK